MIEIVKPSLEEMRFVWANIRAGDRLEMNVVQGATPEWFMIPDGHPLVAKVNSVGAFVFGYQLNHNAVNLWGFGTDLATKHVVELTRYALSYIETLKEKFPTQIIQLLVHQGNRARMRWHLNLGFVDTGFEFNSLRMLRLNRG